MPLVRQSLYSQNINLYLAPTADGRETWLSLLRTIGIEGRCFVVSSNMCTRANPVPLPTSTATSTPVPTIPENPPKARRSSCVTEEGFEIALPHPHAKQSHSHPQRHHARRRSVFDDDGNEIILPCGESSSDAVTPASKPSSPQLPRATTGPVDFLSRGGSAIVSPFGEVLAGPQWEDDEGLIYADVDFDDCIRGRLDLDTGGSYSR